MLYNHKPPIKPLVEGDLDQLLATEDLLQTDLQEGLELSIVMPCLNEAETLATCICKAQQFLDCHRIRGEIIIADNGSTDGSQDIALSLGVRLVNISLKGYGAALIGGIQAARGEFIIMGDSDDSYDFTNLMPFLEKLREGYDLVMGNRFKGGIQPGAMPFLHQYLGNPVLSGLGRLFFHIPINDFHCGLRGFRKASILKLGLQTTGMEYASEMVVKVSLCGLKMVEVPTTLAQAGRSRAPHLRTWRDGWRHLRFLLLYSPRWLFLIPGLVLFGLGSTLLLALVRGPVQIGKLYFDIHFMILGSLLALIGFQIISLGVYAQVYSTTHHFHKHSLTFNLITRYFSLEWGIGVGGLTLLVGLGINLYILFIWIVGNMGFGGQPHLREAILAMTLMVIGVQIIFSSFFLSLLGISKK